MNSMARVSDSRLLPLNCINQAEIFANGKWTQVTNTLNQCHRIESVRFVFTTRSWSSSSSVEWRRICCGRIKMIRGNIFDVEWWHQFDISQSVIHPSSQLMVINPSLRTVPACLLARKRGATFQWDSPSISKFFATLNKAGVAIFLMDNDTARNAKYSNWQYS